MKRVKVEALEEGDVLAKAIFDQRGNLIANEGFEINGRKKEFLIRAGFTEVFIKDDYNNGDVEITEILSAELKNKTVVTMANKDTSDTINCAKQIAEEMIKQKNILFDEIPVVRTEQDKIYKQAVQVCEYSVAVAKHLGITDQNRLKDIAIAALFHNLGNDLLSENDKEQFKINDAMKTRFKLDGDVDTYQRSMSHIYMANLLKNNPEINVKTRNTIITYKENVDGSGFPFGYTSEKIPLEAKIIRICSDYDTLVNEHKLHPLVAMTKMQSEREKKYDSGILNVFFRTLTFFPKGVEVLLSDGRVGIIHENHLGQPDRPTIIFKDGTLLDLSKASEKGYEDLLSITVLRENNRTLEKQTYHRK